MDYNKLIENDIIKLYYNLTDIYDIDLDNEEERQELLELINMSLIEIHTINYDNNDILSIIKNALTIKEFQLDIIQNEKLEIDKLEIDKLETINIEINFSNDTKTNNNEIEIDNNIISLKNNDDIIKNNNYYYQYWDVKTDQEKKDYLLNQLDIIQNLPQPIQRSKEWYEFRNEMLTASDLYKAIGTESSIRHLIIKKCQIDISKKSGGGKACNHGIKYEDIAIKLYEKMNKTKVYDYGCIRHPDFPIFGASPDGICGKENLDLVGRMLEIKCPISREIIKGKVPEMYWQQIQGQLEVCNLWDCDYFECKIIEIDEETYYNEINENKGIIINIYDNKQNKNEYIYSDINIDNPKIWIDKEFDKIIKHKHLTFINLSYWILKDYNCVFVKRDVEWFQSIKPKIISFWDKVIYHRQHGYEELEKQIKRKPKNTTNQIDIMNIKECLL